MIHLFGQVVDPESRALLKVLHVAVQTGRSVLLERLQTQIDPSLEHLITKKVVVVNGSEFIRIGEARLHGADNGLCQRKSISPLLFLSKSD